MEVQIENLTDPAMLSPYASKARIPAQRDKIFKDECFFSFDTPVCKISSEFYIDYDKTKG